jgi:hypothetical protein
MRRGSASRETVTPRAPPQEATRSIVSARCLRLLLVVVAGTLALSCRERGREPRTQAEPSCDAPGAREIVERLGERLKRVSLRAADSILVREIREAYAPLVTPDLLDRWITEPAGAPGREVSSPWPERIEVRSVEAGSDGTCVVQGEVIYVTSVELTRDSSVMREPVTLRLVKSGEWRISTYEISAPSSTEAVSPATEAPADVIRRYYAAINAREFHRAYALWGDRGAASGQTFEQFAAGFAGTARVEVDVGEPTRVEPAAGSRYVEVPVVVRAVAVSGQGRRFEGTYTLRRSVVDGAPAEQRRWHIYSADITRTR